MNTHIRYADAKYLKHEGKKINVKITLKIINNQPVLYIQDFEFVEFPRALRYLQRVSNDVVQERTTAAFVGLQETGDAFKLRLYNIVGEDHPLNGSTVSVQTLVENGIRVPDLSQEEVSSELEKIKLL